MAKKKAKATKAAVKKFKNNKASVNNCHRLCSSDPDIGVMTMNLWYFVVSLDSNDN